MKRLLLLAFGITFCASLGVLVSRYTMAFTTNETVTDRIFSEAGVTLPTDSTDPAILEQLASSSDYPFQNLYLYMYENVLNGPEKAAVKVLAQQCIDGISFSEDELYEITQNADTSAIIDHKENRANTAGSESDLAQAQEDYDAADAALEQFLADNEGAFSETTIDYIRSHFKDTLCSVPTQTDISTYDTQSAILTTYAEVMTAYNKEVDLQRDNRKLAYMTLANEMFLNNDLTDSANIDLLYDLDLAHYVLFGDYITYPDRSGGEDVSLASIPEDSFANEDMAEEDTPVQLSADTVSPYACLDDEALRAALDAFDAEGSGATATAPDASELVYPDSEAIAESVTPADEAVSETTVAAAEEVRQGLEEMQGFFDLLSGTKGDWTRSLPCDDVFCITVKLVDGEEDAVDTSAYAETDNCVACHVAYINQALTATTDHSLVAGKVSTNWFEDATCKDAGNGVNLDFNVYAVKKAIDLDPGDEIDETPQKDVQDLKNRLIHIGALPDGTNIGKTPADLECERLLQLNTVAGSPQTIADVQTQCQEAETQKKTELAAIYDQSQAEGLISNQATMYQQIAAELYKMAVTFRNYQEQMQATYTGDNAPLPALLAKKYCK